jgi:hypothetical protein
MATPYDAVGKDLVEFAPEAWLAFLGQPRPADKVRVVDADLSATVSTSTDKVIRVDDPEPWLVMLELQANWDGDLPSDLLRRYGMLRYRHRVPVSVVVILLRPSAEMAAMTGTFPRADRLGQDWPFPFHVVPVWETPAETIIRGPLAMLPLAPIAGVDPEDFPRVLLAVHNRAFAELPRSQAETLWEATIQLLFLRYDEEFVERWKQDMATLDVSNTALAKLFLSQGRDAGRVEEARENVLALGTRRFGSPPPAVEQQIRSATDLAVLHQMVGRLLDAHNWQELLAEAP